MLSMFRVDIPVLSDPPAPATNFPVHFVWSPDFIRLLHCVGIEPVRNQNARNLNVFADCTILSYESRKKRKRNQALQSYWNADCWAPSRQASNCEINYFSAPSLEIFLQSLRFNMVRSFWYFPLVRNCYSTLTAIGIWIMFVGQFTSHTSVFWLVLFCHRYSECSIGP